MYKKNTFLFIASFLVLSISLRAFAIEEEQYWIAADIGLHKGENHKFFLYIETRSNEDGLQQYYIGPRYNYKISDHWYFGTALKSINIKSNGNYDESYRLEVEMTYATKIGSKGKFDFRNRIEDIYRPRIADILRYRPRLRYRHSLDGDTLKTYFAYQEFVYARTELTEGVNGPVGGSWDLSQSRTVPFGFGLNFGNTFSLNIFYMYQIKYRDEPREDDKVHVMGATFNF